MSQFEIVGVRFRPTEEEIISYYLERKMGGLDFPVHCINEVDVLKFEPWNLPDLSARTDNNMWYFFNAPTYKYANSKRTNRTTRAGYWKVTGKDRPIWDDRCTKVIGFKKNLVFYLGRMPNGIKTNWVIHEFHSNNAPLYQKEFVLWRLKRKSGNVSTSDEPSRGSTSNSGNHDAENTAAPVNHNQTTELDSRDTSRHDHESLSTLGSAKLPMHPGEGPPYSNLSINEIGTSEQADDFFSSLLITKDGYWEKTLIHESDNETIYQESDQVLEPSSLFDTTTSSTEYSQKQMMQIARAPDETPSSSNQDWYKPVKSVVDNPQINYVQFVYGDFPISTKSCKAQFLPKFHGQIEKECPPRALQMKGKISREAIFKDEEREVAEHVLNLPWEKKAEALYTETSLKFRSNLSHSHDSNRKSSSIFLETLSLGRKASAPSIYIRNVVVAVMLLIFFFWTLH